MEGKGGAADDDVDGVVGERSKGTGGGLRDGDGDGEDVDEGLEEEGGDNR